MFLTLKLSEWRRRGLDIFCAGRALATSQIVFSVFGLLVSVQMELCHDPGISTPDDSVMLAALEYLLNSFSAEQQLVYRHYTESGQVSGHYHGHISSLVSQNILFLFELNVLEESQLHQRMLKMINKNSDLRTV